MLQEMTCFSLTFCLVWFWASKLKHVELIGPNHRHTDTQSFNAIFMSYFLCTECKISIALSFFEKIVFPVCTEWSFFYYRIKRSCIFTYFFYQIFKWFISTYFSKCYVKINIKLLARNRYACVVYYFYIK